jgi:hypothetical protein
MKMKLIIVLVVSLAFVGGYFLGCNQTKETMSKSWMHSYLYWHHIDHAQELDRVVLILTQFREGKSVDGMEMLEKSLDGSLLATAGSDEDFKNGQNGIPTYIQEAHDYRVKFPWTNSVPGVYVKVQGILSLAK